MGHSIDRRVETHLGVIVQWFQILKTVERRQTGDGIIGTHDVTHLSVKDCNGLDGHIVIDNDWRRVHGRLGIRVTAIGRVVNGGASGVTGDGRLKGPVIDTRRRTDDRSTQAVTIINGNNYLGDAHLIGLGNKANLRCTTRPHTDFFLISIVADTLFKVSGTILGVALGSTIKLNVDDISIADTDGEALALVHTKLGLIDKAIAHFKLHTVLLNSIR